MKASAQIKVHYPTFVSVTFSVPFGVAVPKFDAAWKIRDLSTVVSAIHALSEMDHRRAILIGNGVS